MFLLSVHPLQNWLENRFGLFDRFSAKITSLARCTEKKYLKMFFWDAQFIHRNKLLVSHRNKLYIPQIGFQGIFSSVRIFLWVWTSDDRPSKSGRRAVFNGCRSLIFRSRTLYAEAAFRPLQSHCARELPLGAREEPRLHSDVFEANTNCESPRKNVQYA